MPNWVCNHLTIHGKNAVEVINSLLSKNCDDEGYYEIDFNKIVPMPKDLNIKRGSVMRDCAKLYVNTMPEDCDAYKKYAALYEQVFGRDLVMDADEQIRMIESVMFYNKYEESGSLFETKADAYAYGKKALDNYEKYGAKDWYDWRIKNWGTLWNAQDALIHFRDKTNIYFSTKWNAPLPVIDALSKQYPGLTFDFEFADEDIGYNTGKITVKNGEIIKGGIFDDSSKQAYELYFSLCGGKDKYRFNAKTGTYEYIGNEEEM